jgi:hypothetical protein
MKKLSLLLGAAVILMMGFAITISNASATDTGFQAAMEPELKSGSSDTQVSAPELAFQELNSKALASIGEGWFYYKDYQKHDVDPPTIEGVIPLVDTTTDYWYYINSSGMVERFVTIQRTMDGQIAQVGIYSDGTAWNTTVDEIVRTETFLFELHYGLPYHLKSPDMKINNIIKNGSGLVEFTNRFTEEKPIDLLDYSKALLSMEYYYYFDAVTGFIVSAKTIAHLEDGTQREFLYVQIEEIKLNAEPPADVLQYFEIKKNREEQK